MTLKKWDWTKDRYPPVIDHVKILCDMMKIEEQKEKKREKKMRLQQIGEKVSMFIKFEETKTWPNFSIHNFVDREGKVISMYGTVKNSPVKIEDLVAGDCVECSGRFAKRSVLRDGTEVTRISHVKITENKGGKK